jgi:hypothetical protein
VQQVTPLLDSIERLTFGTLVVADEDFAARSALVEQARELCAAASGGSLVAKWEVNFCLAKLYEREFGQQLNSRSPAPLALPDIRRALESHLLKGELERLPEKELMESPEAPDAYVQWLKTKIKEHPSCEHAFYTEFLDKRANRAELRYFLAQESTLDPRFDDIVALMQVGARSEAKMEMARNYWDEMGNGEDAKVHSALFQKALIELDVNDSYLRKNVSLEAMVTGNVSACVVLDRRYLGMAVGYFGVTEYVPPRRLKYLVKAMTRNHLSSAAIEYHRLHAIIDAHHALGWFNNVVTPALNANPESRHDISRGAFLRLSASLRYLDDLMNTLSNWGHHSETSSPSSPS